MNVGVVGVGLIGASIGLRARRLGWHVAGYDPDEGALREALERGALDEAVADVGAAVTRRDVAVLAAPVDALAGTLDAVRAAYAAGTVPARALIDVGSVKAPIVRAAAGIPGFVGTHPMAGSSGSGPGAALGSLFHGRPWAYVKAADTPAVESVLAFISAMGARAVEIDAAEHDRIVALTSHLPQAISIVLASLLSRSEAAPRVRLLAGPGLESMTRLAQSPFSMWQGIYAENGHNLVAALRGMARLVEALVDGENVDLEVLQQYFTEANAFAQSVFDGKRIE